jgi:hypothetical protein
MAASSAPWSPNGTWSKPSTFGPKPSRYFCWPPAAIVASVRPWKAPFDGDDAEALGMPVRRVVLPRGLDRALVRLGARIAEEGVVEPGRLDEAPAELLLLGDAIHVRDVPQPLGLALQRLDEMRMAVTERVHRDAAREIEIGRAVGGEERDALASLERELRAGEGRQERVGGGHRAFLFVGSKQNGRPDGGHYGIAMIGARAFLSTIG